ncbi:neuronal tyrosine-phosphorylated phosphoinositide-3-kinase adapter 1, partial [Pseudonaja textilis]|uniref:neuronal tyrosine-phosphorylated phosphoinositide-3-kinase adapter 1 n=1 Tax=Pseudonaja textilis TaxID=8673 RepID=UPI000EAA1177
ATGGPSLQRYGRSASHGQAKGSDVEEDEPVYIEMVGDIFRGPGPAAPQSVAANDDDSDESEAIYEEMKYPLAEDAAAEARPNGGPASPGHRLAKKDSAKAAPGSKTSPCEIPAPFPNLLQHRAPLLAFPQVKKGYKGGPDGSKLPVLCHAKDAPAAPMTPQVPSHHQQRGGADNPALAPSGRARSHSTPLPPQPAGQSKPDKDLPVSHSMICPSAKPAPPAAFAPSGLPGKDKPSVSYTMVYSAVKVTTHTAPSEANAEEISVLQGLLCSRPSPVPDGRQGQRICPLPEPPPLGMVWTYPAPCAGLKRPPAYESIKNLGPKASSAVKIQLRDRTFASIHQVVAGEESGRPAGEDEAFGWMLHRRAGLRKGKEAD